MSTAYAKMIFFTIIAMFLTGYYLGKNNPLGPYAKILFEWLSTQNNIGKVTKAELSPNHKYFTVTTTVDHIDILKFNVRAVSSKHIITVKSLKEGETKDYPIAYSFGLYFGLDIAPIDLDVDLFLVKISDARSHKSFREITVQSHETIAQALLFDVKTLSHFDDTLHVKHGFEANPEDGSSDQE
jgi:hypothetical protein